jgi:LysR family transcriptional regulator, glycine cleavage system transcriptional activator
MDENGSRTMARRIPLAALPAFEAAARLGSFRDAAAELHLTPSAISHQMRGLEQQLGVRLFARSVRRVSPTSEGRTLHEAVARAFDQLEEGLRAIADPAGAHSVTASVTPAFATRWLIPRLGGFQERYPDIRVQLVTTTELSPLAGDIDIAVRYGRVKPGRAVSEPLLTERFVPVANPGHGRRKVATLLRVVWRQKRFEAVSWPAFFAANGPVLGQTRPGPSFEDESHAVLAAVAGQGIALASSVLVADLIEQGALVRVGDGSLPGYRYHLVAQSTRLRRPPVAAFASWLREEARRKPAP